MTAPALSPSPLFPVGHPALCPDGADCPKATVLVNGRYFVTFGHAGFNSRANNRSGYPTEGAARCAVNFYQHKKGA